MEFVGALASSTIYCATSLIGQGDEHERGNLPLESVMPTKMLIDIFQIFSNNIINLSSNLRVVGDS